MQPTTLGFSPSTRGTFLVGLPLLGTALGFFLPRLATAALRLPWVPFQGPIKLVASLHGAWALVTALVGAAAGLWFAFMIIKETLAVTITDREVRLAKDDAVRVVARHDVGAVFLDGKQLVLLTTSGEELAREPHESTPDRIAQAFTSHGYPWSPNGDPHRDAYRRWVPDTPELPAAIDALLKARQRALDKKDARDAADLGREVGKLGYVVRDEQTHQYWRPRSPRG
jgi:hypothetical protein